MIGISSTLKPYTYSESHLVYEAWNWEYISSIPRVVKVSSGIRYTFSGKYGPSLMEEVARYADVATVIGDQHSFDVIHAHDWLTFPAGIGVKKSSGKPLVVHVHATEFDRAGDQHINEEVFAIEKEGMTEADVVVAVSQWTKDILVDKYGIAPAKIKVVHNGVLPNEEPPIASLPKVSDYVVTFLGRITHQKGPQYFIEAARQILQYFPDVHFIMAGAGDLLPAMIDRVAQLKLSTRIHFTGFLKGIQLQQIWSVTDVYIMPSVSEPFGITPLEAIQAGVPVIVSNQSGVAEVMDHAIKVDFWDTSALANAIIGVLKHKGLSESLKVNGKNEVKTLTWKRAAVQLNQLYHEL
jgi:glycosyltransferase involved in cell wall biosynthesis